jgi:hypothetical protein
MLIRRTQKHPKHIVLIQEIKPKISSYFSPLFISLRIIRKHKEKIDLKPALIQAKSKIIIET